MNLPLAARKARTDLVNGTVMYLYADRKVDFVDISAEVNVYLDPDPPFPFPPCLHAAGPPCQSVAGCE
jgi:hypothetical protein